MKLVIASIGRYTAKYSPLNWEDIPQGQAKKFYEGLKFPYYLNNHEKCDGNGELVDEDFTSFVKLDEQGDGTYHYRNLTNLHEILWNELLKRDWDMNFYVAVSLHLTEEQLINKTVPKFYLNSRLGDEEGVKITKTPNRYNFRNEDYSVFRFLENNSLYLEYNEKH